MKTLIIEDEQAPAKHLKKLLQEIDSEISIEGVIESISEAIEWFANQTEPDLIFMDIQLADGLCFEIFNEISIETPIIFITAFDSYTLEAFKLNSIDYLLKPIGKEELQRSLLKFKKLQTKKQYDLPVTELISKLIINQNLYKSRFLIKTLRGFTVIHAVDIAFFHIENQFVYLHLFENKQFTIDYSLDTLETLLDPNEFFRINRQCILNILSIRNIQNYFNNRLILEVFPSASSNIELIVSREKVSAFKKWIEK
jgi:DNA-binding LytR/AlgR family response regulator